MLALRRNVCISPAHLGISEAQRMTGDQQTQLNEQQVNVSLFSSLNSYDILLQLFPASFSLFIDSDFYIHILDLHGYMRGVR